MAKPLDNRVKEILSKLGFDPKQCLWDCHGTWVMYHRYIEIAGAKNSIAYDLTEIETNSKDGIVCIKCIAKRNGDTVITYGEASPKNTKNAYILVYYSNKKKVFEIWINEPYFCFNIINFIFCNAHCNQF